MRPLQCVVDTNVVATAEGANGEAGPACRAASAEALQEVMAQGHLFVDASQLILDEYLTAVGAGQPEAGGAFVRWVLQNLWRADRVTQVPITPRTDGTAGFVELPTPADGTTYDPADEKFLAVAAAHPDHPPILQAFDSKWWGWTQALAACGVSIHFLCPDEIKAKYDEKTGA